MILELNINLTTSNENPLQNVQIRDISNYFFFEYLDAFWKLLYGPKTQFDAQLK